MIYKKVIKIEAESYLEEQFILQKFPGVVWYPPIREGYSTFYLPMKEEASVKEALNEFRIWKEKNRE
jgi:hypothetical protein